VEIETLRRAWPEDWYQRTARFRGAGEERAAERASEEIAHGEVDLEVVGGAVERQPPSGLEDEGR
jgi:hypothetical protein